MLTFQLIYPILFGTKQKLFLKMSEFPNQKSPALRFESAAPGEIKNRCIVKVKTCFYHSKSGIHSRKDITYLSRKSVGNYNWLVDESQCVGADCVFSRITNLDSCEDGIYEVITANESRDWETGMIDDYDFALVAYKE